MKRRFESRHVVALGLALALSACVGPGDPTGRSEAAITVPLGAVSVLDSGSWQNFVRCDTGGCYYNFNFWVDLTVQWDPSMDEVGIEYSTDEWATSKTEYAQFKGDLSDGRERWGRDVSLGIAQGQPPEIQVRAFVRLAGTTVYEPRVHYIYNPVSTTQPVRLLWSNVSYQAGQGASLNGRVRVFNFADDLTKAVTVRYTTDGWATVQEAPATLIKADDWGFQIPLGSTTLPPGVDFAIRYYVPSQEFWDNNGSNNFHHTIAPQFSTSFDVPATQQTTDALSGVFSIYGTFTSDLPVSTIEAQLDGGPWSSGNALSFTTVGLTDGPHRVTFRATLVGGYQSTTDVPFGVRNQVVPLREWGLTSPTRNGELPVDAAADHGGRVFVLFPNGLIARYDSVGQADPALTFYVAASAHRIAIDEASRLYVLDDSGGTLWRHSADGVRDRGFGTNGAVNLNDPANGGTHCYQPELAVGAGYAFIADACGPHVDRFSEFGDYDGVAQVGSQYSWAQSGLFFGADTLWVLTTDSLVKIDNRSGQPMIAGPRLDATGLGQGSPRALAQTANGTFWSIDGSNRLVAFDAGGARVTSWRGEVTQQHFAGELADSARVLALPDGTVAVLSSQQSKIVQFGTPPATP